MTQFMRRRQELNALPISDYEAVDRVKSEYLQQLFAEQGKTVMASKEFQTFVADNEKWLKPYADWQMRNENEELKEMNSSFVYFVQFLLHQQLAAADYAREKGVVLKGDLPIGVHRDSVDIQQYPQLFNLASTAGAPPDNSSMMGYNWGIPTYRWSDELVAWFRRRMKHMEQYFDALRVDHILGFFRIWEIPDHAISGLLGHFSPALPLTVDEIEYFGLPFRKELYTRPFINDRQLERLFGVHAQYVRDHFLVSKAYNLYDLKDDFNTQRKVAAYFGDRRDENSLWIRDGLMRLISNVLFVEDPRQPDMYHPRIGVINEPVFDVLSSEEKDAFVRLYNNYFYQRHSFFWGQQALKRLPAVMKEPRMLFVPKTWACCPIVWNPYSTNCAC